MQHSWLDSGSFSLLIMLLSMGWFTSFGVLLYRLIYWIWGENTEEVSEPSIEGNEARTIKASTNRTVA